MLLLSKSLANQPIMSLRTGARIATATEPIINPGNLKILGWRCKLHGVEAILLAEDVRDVNAQGLVIDDEAALSAPDDLVRHREVLDIRFQLIGKPVKTARQKLGKVGDWAYDEESMFIQQLHVEPPLTKLFGSHDTKIIGRGQVKEITDDYILVSDAEVEVSATEPVSQTAEAPLAEAA